MTLLGTVAADRLLDRLTTIPPAGAGPERVTVPVEDVSPITVAGLIVIVSRAGGLMVRVAVCSTVPRVALIVADTWVPTEVVLTVNVEEALPASMETVEGTMALVELLTSLSTSPPTGAGPLRVTVPTEEVPPDRLVGLSPTDASAGGAIMRFAVWETELSFAVIVTDT